MEEYGPFATVIAITTALIATFSLMLVEAVGRLNQWTGLIPDTRPFVVRYGAQALAVALIGLTFITISKENYIIFAGLAVAFGIGMIVSIAFFERLRRVHVLRVPVTGSNGAQARNNKGKLIYTNLLIGTESGMLPHAVKAYKNARKNNPLLSIEDYLSGTGP